MSDSVPVRRSGRLATAAGSLVREGRSVAYAEQTVAMYF